MIGIEKHMTKSTLRSVMMFMFKSSLVASSVRSK